jgi:transposase
MPTVADVVDAVIAIDTHADSLAAAVAAPSGVLLAQCEFPASGVEIEELIGWALAAAPGPRAVFAIEGTRSYGIGLARAVTRLGIPVIELERPARGERRGRGKTDAIDAALGARKALGLDAAALPTPRADGDREALRILLIARREMTTEKTAKTNRLIALLRTGEDSDRALVRRRLATPALTRIARRRGQPGDTREQAIRRAEARRLALTIIELNRALAANKTELTAIVNELASGLTDRNGIGPVSAAQAITSFSHRGRCRNEAAYARLGGASPLEASSGRTKRHRLNRGGDRALNRALHDITRTRMIHCPRTRDYVARRRAQGVTDREIRRCLKRYIARELYRTLNRCQPLTTHRSVMGPRWGRTVRHRSAQPVTTRHASCPLTCTDVPGQNRSAPSGMPGVGLLIRGLGVQVPRGAPFLTWPFAFAGGGPESLSGPDGTEVGPGNLPGNWSAGVTRRFRNATADAAQSPAAKGQASARRAPSDLALFQLAPTGPHPPRRRGVAGRKARGPARRGHRVTLARAGVFAGR